MVLGLSFSNLSAKNIPSSKSQGYKLNSLANVTEWCTNATTFTLQVHMHTSPSLIKHGKWEEMVIEQIELTGSSVLNY